MDNSAPTVNGMRETGGDRSNGRPAGSDPQPALLAVEGLTKQYGGVRALRNVSLDIRSGEVHALVGANGAG